MTYGRDCPMPGKRMNSVKDKKVYEAVKKKSGSKRKAAKIANAAAKKKGKK